MEAIQILKNKDKQHGRPVDRIEKVLYPGCTPWGVAQLFAQWISEQLPAKRSAIDPANDRFKAIAKMYINQAKKLIKQEQYFNAYVKIRMLALLQVEAVGFGKQGRNARKTQVRQLLKLCRKWQQEQQKPKAEPCLVLNTN